MPFPTIALVGRYQDSGLQTHLRDLAMLLVAAGRTVLIESETANHTGVREYPCATYAEIGQRADLAIVTGGDGTMLGFGRQLAAHGIPLIGINQGRLGFITDIALDQLEAKLEPMLKGEYAEDHRVMMHAEVWRGDERVLQAEALNDVVVNRGASAGMVELRVSVRYAHRFHRLFLVCRWPAAATLACRVGDGADCAAHIVQPAAGAGRSGGNTHRIGGRA